MKRKVVLLIWYVTEDKEHKNTMEGSVFAQPPQGIFFEFRVLNAFFKRISFNWATILVYR